jgi:branched-chain amino acid aminotransferase
MYVYLNGEYLKRKEAKISAFDKGFLYGEGLFDTMRIYHKKAYHLSMHYDRLKNSAKQLKIPLTITLAKLREIIATLLHFNGLSDAYVRITISPGAKAVSNQPTTLVEVSDDLPREYEKYQVEGVTITIYPDKRSPYTHLYRYKTTSFMDNMMARRYAQEQHAQEAIFINHKLEVTEGATSNIFIVKTRAGLAQPPFSRILSSNKVVYTASIATNILPGITRQVVIGLCTKNGLKVREKTLRLKNLIAADEIFLTNSLMGVMPVAKIIYNDRIHHIGDNGPGPITQLLIKEYNNLVS